MSMKKISTEDLKKLHSLLTKKNRKENIDIFFNVDVPIVQKLWKTIVGKALSVHSLPYKIQKKTLFVRVDHPLYSQQLQFHKKEILQRLHQNLLAIEELESTIGTIYWNNERKSKVQDKVSLSNTLTKSQEDESLSQMWNRLIDSIENY